MKLDTRVEIDLDIKDLGMIHDIISELNFLENFPRIGPLRKFRDEDLDYTQGHRKINITSNRELSHLDYNVLVYDGEGKLIASAKYNRNEIEKMKKTF
jgi:hypothetical protein